MEWVELYQYTAVLDRGSEVGWMLLTQQYPGAGYSVMGGYNNFFRRK